MLYGNTTGIMVQARGPLKFDYDIFFSIIIILIRAGIHSLDEKPLKKTDRAIISNVDDGGSRHIYRTAHIISYDFFVFYSF